MDETMFVMSFRFRVVVVSLVTPLNLRSARLARPKCVKALSWR